MFDSFGYYDHEKDGTKCCYELEYILGGNLKDRDNLAGVITKILSVRAVMSLIHIFSSREKRAETYAFAASILGFTGMPMLIRVLQVLVIFVWAFEEALVETAALLRGKKVKIIADDSSFAVSFPEVFLMGKTLINEKAGAFNGATGLDYKSYLIMLLLVEKESTCNYRTMDVIQENIRQKNDSFRMSSLIYGFNIEADFELPALFRVFGGNTAYIFGFCGGERY